MGCDPSLGGTAVALATRTLGILFRQNWPNLPRRKRSGYGLFLLLHMPRVPACEDKAFVSGAFLPRFTPQRRSL